jgi:cleavage stimulation factor subunit 3
MCLEDAEIIEPTLIWIHYIRFVRRVEGLQAARKLFKRAREDPRCKYHLYIANADLEYLFTKDEKIGFKIFLLGAKKFSNESEYMLAYLKYMAHLNGKFLFTSSSQNYFFFN